MFHCLKNSASRYTLIHVIYTVTEFAADPNNTVSVGIVAFSSICVISDRELEG